MELFLISFVVMLMAVLAMAVGILFGRPCIKGTCGGLNNVRGLAGGCGACASRRDKEKTAV